MNKNELITQVSESTDLPKATSERVLNALLETITNELKKGGSVALIGFGTFQVSARSARKGRNPQTGAEIDIAAANVPAFKAGSGLKSAVNSSN